MSSPRHVGHRLPCQERYDAARPYATPTSIRCAANIIIRHACGCLPCADGMPGCRRLLMAAAIYAFIRHVLQHTAQPSLFCRHACGARLMRFICHYVVAATYHTFYDYAAYTVTDSDRHRPPAARLRIRGTSISLAHVNNASVGKCRRRMASPQPRPGCCRMPPES